jgi:hypothetical protein
MESFPMEAGMAILYALPVGSALVAGGGVLVYLIYLTSEFHESARPRRRPKV